MVKPFEFHSYRVFPGTGMETPRGRVHLSSWFALLFSLSTVNARVLKKSSSGVDQERVKKMIGCC